MIKRRIIEPVADLVNTSSSSYRGLYVQNMELGLHVPDDVNRMSSLLAIALGRWQTTLASSPSRAGEAREGRHSCGMSAGGAVYMHDRQL